MYDSNMDKSSLQWLFGAVTRLHHNYMHSFLRSQGLTEITHPRLLFLIEHLERQGREPAQRELAQMLRVSPASIAVSLKRMEKSGLVERSQAENDSRRNVIRTTEKCRALNVECQRMLRELETSLFEGFSDQEHQQLAGYFTRILANLEAMGATIQDPFHSGGREE